MRAGFFLQILSGVVGGVVESWVKWGQGSAQQESRSASNADVDRGIGEMLLGQDLLRHCTDP